MKNQSTLLSLVFLNKLNNISLHNYWLTKQLENHSSKQQGRAYLTPEQQIDVAVEETQKALKRRRPGRCIDLAFFSSTPSRDGIHAFI